MHWLRIQFGTSLGFACSLWMASMCIGQEVIKDADGNSIGFRYVGNSADIDLVLRQLGDPEAVEEVFLGNHDVTGLEVDFLQSFPNLNALAIGDFPDEKSRVTNEAMKSIVQLKELECLVLNVDQSLDVDWSVLADAKKLRRLQICGKVKFTDADLDGILRIPRLEALTLRGNFNQVSNLRALGASKSLSWLALDGDGLTRFADEIIENGHSLTQLELPSVMMSVEQLHRLEDMHGGDLEVLIIGFASTQCFSSIHRFKKLVHLAIVMPEAFSMEISATKLPPTLKSLVLRSE